MVEYAKREKISGAPELIGDDAYVHFVLKHFHQKYPIEYSLLKAYDRAFWFSGEIVGIQKNMAHVIHKPCVFGDPKQTGTLVPMVQQ